MESVIKEDRIIISSRGCMDNHSELQCRRFLRCIYKALVTLKHHKPAQQFSAVATRDPIYCPH